MVMDNACFHTNQVSQAALSLYEQLLPEIVDITEHLE